MRVLGVSEPTSSRALSLLIVDDEELVRRSVARMLRRECVAVTMCEGADEALDALARGAFDVVISDFMMPKKNGVALLHEVRRRVPSVYRVLLSAFAESDEVARAVADGVIHLVLEKPFRMAALVDGLRTVAHASVESDTAGRAS